VLYLLSLPPSLAFLQWNLWSVEVSKAGGGGGGMAFHVNGVVLSEAAGNTALTLHRQGNAKWEATLVTAPERAPGKRGCGRGVGRLSRTSQGGPG
jgi:hypothetical protein